MKRNNIIVNEFSPIELKKNITGNGNAEKVLVQSYIKKIFNLKNLPEYDDAADALGLAYLSKINS
ncbi:MAG: crossover junction endodeoxyribonuclease RuvC [Candidatus Absconditabacteria bacterium]